MKPPRKPSRPHGKSSPPRGRTGAPARTGKAGEARRVADSWGVREDKPAQKSRAAAAKGQQPRTEKRREERPAKSAPLRKSTFQKGPDSKASVYRDRASSRPQSRGPRADANRPRAASSPVQRTKSADEPQRIAKLLARAGVASRREVERMIEDGRIAVNGDILDTPATLLTSLKGVTVDGDPVADAEETRLFLFHKPGGCLTAERDFTGRKTIYDVLPEGLPRLMPVGRLDMNTEGLLLLTNDGELKRKMELPSTGVERTYRARAFGEISQSQLEELIHGIEVDGVRYGRIDANLERRTGRNQWIEMTLTEGKNREVRRVLEHLDLKVNRLIRTRYGPFQLGESAPGEVAEAKAHELEQFVRDMRRRDT